MKDHRKYRPESQTYKIDQEEIKTSFKASKIIDKKTFQKATECKQSKHVKK